MEENKELQPLQKHFQILSNMEAFQEEDIEEAIFFIRNALEGPSGFRLLTSKMVKPLLYAGLKHPHKDVQRLVLSQFQRCASNQESISILDDENIWNLFFEILASDDIGLSDKVAQIIIQLSSFPEGLKMIFHNNVLSQLKKCTNLNETVKFRIYNLFASISSSSTDAFQLCETTGSLQAIVESIDSDDVLQQLNVIELLDKIISTHEGAPFLEKANTFGKLKNILDSEDPLASFLIPRIILFFDKLSSKGEMEAQFLEKYSVVSSLKKHLEEGTQEVKETVLTAIGDIGSTNYGLSLLESLNMFEDYFYNLQIENLRICFLHSLASLLKNISSTISPKWNTTLKSLLQEVPTRQEGKENFIKIVMGLISQPFPELRYAIYDCLSSLAKFSWGVMEEIKYPGFFEWMTNRETDDTKAGKEWKFTLIQNVVETTKKNPEILDKVKQVELVHYLKAGIFWKDAEARMEIETKDIL